jgi:hypothetical protein
MPARLLSAYSAMRFCSSWETIFFTAPFLFFSVDRFAVFFRGCLALVGADRLLGWWSQNAPANCIGGLFWGESGYS